MKDLVPTAMVSCRVGLLIFPCTVLLVLHNVNQAMCCALLWLPVVLQITNNAQAVPVGGGAAVTASATVQAIATDCPANSPAPGPAPPAPTPTPAPTPQSLSPPVVTINPGVAAGVAGSYVWAVAIQNAAGGSITMPYSDSRQVRYTVSATRTQSGAANTVTGEVTVANPNTAPLSITSVLVTLSGGAEPVAAVCPGSLPAVLPAGGNVVCTFAATATSAEAGRISATASSSAGTGTTTQSAPYSFSTATTAASNGKCAVISNQFTPLPIFTARSFSVADDRQPGNDIAVCEDTTYTFTASLGPFTSTNCGVQTVGLLSLLHICLETNNVCAVQSLLLLLACFHRGSLCKHLVASCLCSN